MVKLYDRHGWLPYIENHDEIVLTFSLTEAGKLSKVVQSIFEEPVEEMGGLKLHATVGIGQSWADAK